MKIGLVCPYNIHKPGGVLEVVLALKLGLESRGHIVKIITPKPRNHDEEPEEDKCVFQSWHNIFLFAICLVVNLFSCKLIYYSQFVYL